MSSSVAFLTRAPCEDSIQLLNKALSPEPESRFQGLGLPANLCQAPTVGEVLSCLLSGALPSLALTTKQRLNGGPGPSTRLCPSPLCFCLACTPCLGPLLVPHSAMAPLCTAVAKVSLFSKRSSLISFSFFSLSPPQSVWLYVFLVCLSLDMSYHTSLHFFNDFFSLNCVVPTEDLEVIRP